MDDTGRREGGAARPPSKVARSGSEPRATPGAYPCRGCGDRDRARAPRCLTRPGGALRRALGRHAHVDRAGPSRRPPPAGADEPPTPVRRAGGGNRAARPRPHPLTPRPGHLHGAMGRHAVGDRGPVPHQPSQPCAGERPAAARPSHLGDVASHPGPRPGSRPCRAPPQPHARPQAHRGRLERALSRPPRRHADRHRPALRRRPAPARPRERPPRPCPPHHGDAAARAGARDTHSHHGSRRRPRRPGRSAGRSTIGAPTTASTPISSGPSPGRSRGGTPKPSRLPARGASCR